MCLSSCGGRWIHSLLSESTWGGWSVSTWAVRPHLTKGDSKMMKTHQRQHRRVQRQGLREGAHKWGERRTRTKPKKCLLPVESLTASSWPFFLVQMYFPLLAFSATLWPSHSTENMAFADLKLDITREKENETFLAITCFWKYCDNVLNACARFKKVKQFN